MLALRCLGLLIVLPCVLPASPADPIQSRPLQSAVGEGVAGALYEVVLPAESGTVFENRFDHPERWRSLWRQYFIGSIGTGICLGDVNGDDMPDIFAVGKDSPHGLFLNRGGFAFDAVTEEAGVAGSGGVGSAAGIVDVDNDGDLDLYICYVGSPNELFINDGTGIFSEQAAQWGLNLDTGSNCPSFADYDRDGDLDLYLQRNYLERSGEPMGLTDILLEQREGRFVDVTESSGIYGKGRGHAAVWWDYDEDGWPDLYVANDFEPDDRLYRNNGDGSFTNVLKETFLFAPYSAMGADFGDMNNDGHPDFIVGEMAPTDRAYYLQSVGPLSGKLFSTDSSGVDQFMQNAIAAQIEPGRFTDVGFLSGMEATDWTWATRLVDMDNDGALDAFFTNGMPRAFHDADLGLRVARAPNRNIQVALYQRSPPLLESNLAFRNRGSFRFEETSDAWGLALKGVSFAAAFADFDVDGDMDLVVGNWKENFTLYRNRSEAGDRMVIRLIGNESNSHGLGAKISARVGDRTQYRELSSLRGYMSNDEAVAHFAFEAAEHIDELRIDWPSGKRQILHQLPTGRRYRIAEAESEQTNARRPRETLFLQFEDFTLPTDTVSAEALVPVSRHQALLPFSEDRQGPPLLVKDLNGDGWKDLVLGGPKGVPPRVLRNEQGRGLSLVENPGFAEATAAETTSVAAFDIDLDGDEDLLLANGGIESQRGDPAYSDQIYRNESQLKFTALDRGGPLGRARATGPIAVADFDGDGRQTVLIAGGPLAGAYPWSEPNRVLEQGEAGLVASDSAFAAAFAACGKITDLLVADWDADGDSDLAHCEQWGGLVLWLNEDGALRRRDDLLTPDALLEGYWSSLASGDFNGDGRLDLLVGNLGLNTKYRPQPEEPYELYFSADPDAQPRLFIDVEWEEGQRFAMETRTLHQMYLPEEMAATGSYEDYANTPFEEIFTEDVRKRLERRLIREARSMILLQDASGRFSPLPLPDLAQAGRMTDCIAADLDGDGDLDVALINESLAPQPWVARRPNRAHLCVLINDGTGNFDSLLPWDSGLSIPLGEPKRLAFEDLDNDGVGELLVATSDGPLYIFTRNHHYAQPD